MMSKRYNAKLNDTALHLRGPKHLWDRKSIFILLNEYRKLKEFFNMMQVGQERKELWERITKKLHSAGYSNIHVQHVIKKFRSLRKDYRKLIGGFNVGSRLYGYVNLLKDILHDDPYLFSGPPYIKKNKPFSQSEYDNQTVDKDEVNETGSHVDKAPPWVVNLVDHFKEEQNKISYSIWKLHENIIAAEKKKNDLLDSLINCLKSDYTSAESVVPSNDTTTTTSQPNQNTKGLLFGSIGVKRKSFSYISEKHFKPKILKASYVKNTLSPNVTCDEEGSKVTVCTVPKIQFTYLDEKNGKLVSHLGQEGSVYEVHGFYGDDPSSQTVKPNDEHNETAQAAKTLSFINFSDSNVNCSVKIISAAEFKKMFQECNK